MSITIITHCNSYIAVINGSDGQYHMIFGDHHSKVDGVCISTWGILGGPPSTFGITSRRPGAHRTPNISTSEHV